MALRTRSALIVLVLAGLLSGCGGGSGSAIVDPPPGGGGGGGDQPTARKETGTARFDVDVASGQVKVTPLESTSRAVFSGSAVSFNSSTLVDQPGNTGLRILKVSLTNRWAVPIGVVNGSSPSLRVVFGELFNGTPGGGLVAATQVEPTSVTNALVGLAAASSGVVFATSGHAIYRFEGNNLKLWAGRTSAGSTDSLTVNASFSSPRGLAINPADGALFVADTGNHRIRRIDIGTGRVTTVAGSTAGSTNGPGSTATLTAPSGLAFRNSNDLLVTCGDGSVRRIVHSSGSVSLPASYTVSTWATGLSNPDGLAVAPDGSVYVADAGFHRIFLVTNTNAPVAIAGTGAAGLTDGAGQVAKFNAPRGLVWAEGGLVVAEYGSHRLRRVTLTSGGNPQQASAWQVALLAGSSVGASGNNTGTGVNSRFNRPWGLAAVGGTVWVADYSNSRLRRVLLPSGTQGSGDGGGSSTSPVRLTNADGAYTHATDDARPYIDYGGGGLDGGPLAPGASTAAREWWFNVPAGVRQFSFVVRVEAHTAHSLSLPFEMNRGSAEVNVTSVICGESALRVDGPTLVASLDGNDDLVASRDGSLYVASKYPGMLRRFDGQTMALIAGGAPSGTDGVGRGIGFSDALYLPAVSPDGQVVYVPDYGAHTIRRLTCAGDPQSADSWSSSTIAGSAGSWGYANGAGDVARFYSPTAVIFISDTRLVVIENGARLRSLRLVGPNPNLATSWQVEFLAGDNSGAAPTTGTTDGAGSIVRFNGASRGAFDGHRSIYLADKHNDRIRRVSLTGHVTTFAGPSGATVSGGYLDATGDLALFSGPSAVAVDAAGYVLVADEGNNRLRIITPAREVRTVAGGGTESGRGTGDVANVGPIRSLALGPSGTAWSENYATPAALLRFDRIIGAGTQ